MGKTFLIASTMLLITINCFGQPVKTDYLQKSKHQKTIFYVVAGTGAALMIGGLLYSAGHNDSDNQSYGYTGGFIALGGLALTGVSMPFLISSIKNKRRAVAISLKNEKLLQFNKSNIVYKPLPSLSLTIGL